MIPNWMLTEDAFPSDSKPLVCENGDMCEELHNEENPDGTFHHYGCECSHCQLYYWKLGN